MIAFLLSTAAAGVQCASSPVLHVGTGAVAWVGERPITGLFPSDVGLDVMATVAPIPCLRLGTRFQAYWDRFDAGLNPGGIEAHHKFWGTLGTELALHERVDVGVHGLLGTRLLVSNQRVNWPEFGIDRSYRSTSFRPSAYGYGVVRVWVLPWLGVHVDGQIAVVDHRREYSWYTNRILGAGLSGRWKKRR